MTTHSELQAQRHFIQSGATRPYTWRREQLQRLYDLVAASETAIHQALHADLKKGREETYATETGLVLAEIRHTLKHLKKCRQHRRPQAVRTGAGYCCMVSQPAPGDAAGNDHALLWPTAGTKPRLWQDHQ